MPHPNQILRHSDEIGRYRLGNLYSESFSGVPYETDLQSILGVGRSDSFNPYTPDPGGLQKSLRKIVFLHETSHFVHDLSLGTSMELDYIWDSALAALLQIIFTIQDSQPLQCPILEKAEDNQIERIPEISAPLEFLKEREALASALLSKPSGLSEFAVATNSVFKSFRQELSELSGLALMEALVAVKTLVAITLRAHDAADIAYLADIKESVPILPERLPAIYTTARRLFDGTIGRMLRIGTDYYRDAWPCSYTSSPRSISDEGFIYLADMALHIPPFEYSVVRIRKGQNTWQDFIPACRFLRAIDAILQAGAFPPLKDPSAPNQFYRTVFDFVGQRLSWPSYEETNSAWMGKLKKYKEQRQESADGYRFRLLVEKHLRPSDIVFSDCVEACMKQFVPILHLTPTGLKLLGGYAIGDQRYYTSFEVPDLAPYHAMRRDLPLWKDLPSRATIDDLDTETGNQELFRQEIVYRIIAGELKNAVLYDSHFVCPFAGFGCEVASKVCERMTCFDAIPTEGCCLRFYAEQKHIQLSRLHWSR